MALQSRTDAGTVDWEARRVFLTAIRRIERFMAGSQSDDLAHRRALAAIRDALVELDQRECRSVPRI